MGPGDNTEALLAQLRDDLGYRRIEQGLQSLERIKPTVEALDPKSPHSGVLLGLVAQWVDAGFDGPDILRLLLTKFPPSVRATLPLSDYLHLRMAEGKVAMSQEDLDRAAGHFRFVQSLEQEVDDRELFAIANFWTGRCLRITGQYDDALNYIVRGEELALECGYTQMAAIMQATRSWLAFQKGKLHEAITILGRAEEALSRTNDFLSRGNVQSAYGRIARRQGRYERALEYLEAAIAEYRQGGRAQLQLARALLNLAFVNRRLALKSQKEFDRASASRRSAKQETEQHTELTRNARLEIERIRGQARAQLDEAMEIYARHNNHRGIAGVHINRGFLFLDSGDLDCAAAESAEAFRHGEEKRDYITMARARMLQCVIENAALEEQFGDPARHQEAAEISARDAVGFASQTQDQRLLARTLVWQGLTFWRFGSRAPLLRPGSSSAAAAGLRTAARVGRSRAAPGHRSARPPNRSFVAIVERRPGRRQDFPANHRGIRRRHHPQGLGTRRPQSVARGRTALHITEESAPHTPRGRSASQRTAT